MGWWWKVLGNEASGSEGWGWEEACLAGVNYKDPGRE